jgi:hypothetical protein
MQRACCIIVLQGQLSLGIRPRTCAGIRYAVGSYDLSRHAAPPLGATRLVRQRPADEGKSGPLGPGFLDGPVSERQPLPWPGIGWGLGWYVSFEAHPGSGDFVTRPTVHVIKNIRR